VSEIAAGIARLEALEKQAEAVDRDRELGPGALTPRGRLAALIEPGSALEVARLARSQQPGLEDETPADGLHTVFGRVAGQELLVLVEDPIVLARTDAEVARAKRNRALAFAAMLDRPVVFVIDGAEQRPVFPAEAGALHGRSADPRHELDPARHLAPRIAVVCGPVSGTAREWLGLCDWVVATRAGAAGVTPDLVDITVDDDLAAVRRARSLLCELLADPAGEAYPVGEQDPLPEADAGPWDARELAERLFDDASIAPLADDGGCLRVLLGRIGGWLTVAVLPRANEPAVLTRGDLRRLERALRFAARTGLPVLLLQNFRGLAPDAQRDSELLARINALHRAAEVPRLLLVTGSGHVLGAAPLGSRSLGADIILAWPSARVSLTDPPSYQPLELDRARAADPWLAAGRGLFDDVITPAETRRVLHRYLSLLGGRTGASRRSGYRPHDR
jgi:acetyl-CoA carboxylase carboxyltransferase component